MKRILAVFAVCCLCLTGCVNGVATPTQTATTTTTTTTAATTTTTTTESTTTTTTAQTEFRMPFTGLYTATTTQPNASDGFALTAEQIASLDALIGSYEKEVSVGYYDVRSGYTYTYNADHVYMAASVIKAPFCRYVLGIAEELNLDLTQLTSTYTEKMFAPGTGIIQESEYGTVYTHKRLIELAMCESDNTAFKMLRTAYNTEQFKKFAESIGIENIAGIKNVSSSRLNITDALTYVKDLYAYVYGDTRYGKWLEELMLRTNYPMITSSYPVLRKYGWMDNAYHDMAIINAPRPYFVVILTDHDEGTAADLQMFRDISMAIEAVSGNG